MISVVGFPHLEEELLDGRRTSSPKGRYPRLDEKDFVSNQQSIFFYILKNNKIAP
jgi:hypothetical protein